jgi:hypothetical protein
MTQVNKFDITYLVLSSVLDPDLQGATLKLTPWIRVRIRIRDADSGSGTKSFKMTEKWKKIIFFQISLTKTGYGAKIRSAVYEFGSGSSNTTITDLLCFWVRIRNAGTIRKQGKSDTDQKNPQ